MLYHRRSSGKAVSWVCLRYVQFKLLKCRLGDEPFFGGRVNESLKACMATTGLTGLTGSSAERKLNSYPLPQFTLKWLVEQTNALHSQAKISEVTMTVSFETGILVQFVIRPASPTTDFLPRYYSTTLISGTMAAVSATLWRRF
jgi:hypothetical protein